MNDQTISIRMATPEDAETITRHRCAMFSDMDKQHQTGLEAMAATFTPYVRRELAKGGYRGWLACTDDGTVIAGGGLMVYEWPARPNDPNTQRAYILNVYTEPAYRRQGIARRIVTSMVDWCRAQGFKTVSLHASEDGYALYKSMDFKPTNEMRLKL